MQRESQNRWGLWRRLTEPHGAVQGEKRRNAVFVLASFMLGLFVVSVLYGAAYSLLRGELFREAWLSAVIFLAGYLLSRSPYPVMAELVIVTGWLGFTVLLLLATPEVYALAWALVPILLATVLLPMWAAVVVNFFSFVVPFGIVLLSGEADIAALFSMQTVIAFTAMIAVATKYARERDQALLERQAEALARSRARYKELFEDVPIGLFESTPQGKIVSGNRALLAILGLPDLQTLQEAHAPDLYVDPADRERWMATLLEEGLVQNYELQVKGVGGRPVWVREHVRAVHDADGNLLHFRGSIEDVTEHRRLRRQLAEQHEAVRAYAAELEQRNDELDAFSHSVAHDLRRPLMHMVGYTELLRQIVEEAGAADGLLILDRIEAASMNMSEMVSSLLLLAQLRGAQDVAQPVNMLHVIRAAVSRIQQDIDARGVQLHIAEPIPNATGYGPWLQEALVNLLSNSVKYIGSDNADPRITIRAAAQGDMMRYEVADNGLGIAAEDQPYLFEMLTRFHKHESDGTGLGLSIVQRVVEKLGGEVGVQSAPGEGSVFWLTLPAA